jgi:DNA topoisomerase III
MGAGPPRPEPTRGNASAWPNCAGRGRSGARGSLRYRVEPMAKTLIIAEKPSVGRDLSEALPGTFTRRKLEELTKKTKKAAADDDGAADDGAPELDEKPARGRKLETVFLEGDDYVITWAVGHLVELVEPEAYDEKFKKWRMADLPIVPEAFTLQPRDANSKKQLKLIEKLLKR